MHQHCPREDLSELRRLMKMWTEVGQRRWRQHPRYKEAHGDRSGQVLVQSPVGPATFAVKELRSRDNWGQQSNWRGISSGERIDSGGYDRDQGSRPMCWG